MPQKSETQKRYVIVGNQSYGLYYGQTDATDEQIIATHAVRLYGCRHIARWLGKTGGITSLAATGPVVCRKVDGAMEHSRIGAPADALLTGVVNVYDVSPEAVEAFARVEARDA